MKGKRVLAGILLAGFLAVTLAGCKNTDNTKEEPEKPVITLGSDNYPPYNYLNEDGVPTGIDVELATEAFKRMGYQVEVVQINWEKKKELVESGEIGWDGVRRIREDKRSIFVYTGAKNACIWPKKQLGSQATEVRKILDACAPSAGGKKKSC